MKRKLTCMVLAVVMCLSIGSIALAAPEGSPADGWLKYDTESVPDGYVGTREPTPDAINDMINDYAQENHPGMTVEEIGFVAFIDEAKVDSLDPNNIDEMLDALYFGSATLYVEDASVTAGDKVTIICVDVDGNIIEVTANAEDGGFSFNVPTPGFYSYFVVKGETNDTADTSTSTTNTTAKSPKTGGDDR